MASFLDLCRVCARESGTIPHGYPVVVEGATGRDYQVVEWVREAWLSIQNERARWRWMQGEFSSPLIPGISRYLPDTLGISRFVSFPCDPRAVTIYDPDLGVRDESPMFDVGFETWRGRFMVGEQQPQRPEWFSLAPDGKIAFGPTPDKAYVIRGIYQRGPQELVESDDVPEMPERFHSLIALRALRYLHEHDEAVEPRQAAYLRENELMRDLIRDQAPIFSASPGALA